MVGQLDPLNSGKVYIVSRGILLNVVSNASINSSVSLLIVFERLDACTYKLYVLLEVYESDSRITFRSRILLIVK